MKLLAPLALIGLLLTPGARAEPAAPPGGAASEAARAEAERADATASGERMRAAERRLAAARERLEAAAREVAELSASLVPSDLTTLNYHLGGGKRAVLGLQLGESRAAGGIRVVHVSPGGPAGEAGVRSGDVLISVNGKRVRAAADVSEQLKGLAPGAVARIEVERSGGGKAEQLNVTTRALEPHFEMLFDADTALTDLDQMLRDQPLLAGGAAHLLPGFGGMGDLELAPLSHDLGRYFGADKGVLVIKAPEDAAWQLRDGDVITSIDGRDPQSSQHALRILGSYQAGEHLTLAVLRDRKPLKLELTMPQHAARHLHAHPPAPPAPPAPPVPAAPPAPPPPPASAT